MTTGGDVMRLREQMEPKLDEIRRLAKQRFVLVDLHESGLHFDRSGNVDIDYNSPSNHAHETGPAWYDDPVARQAAIDRGVAMSADLDEFLQYLSGKVEPLLDLDPLDLTGVLGTLGGAPERSPTDNPTAVTGGTKYPSSTELSITDSPTTVAGRIGYAYSECFSKVDELFEHEHWSGPAALEFQSDFVTQFQGVSVNQREMIRALGITVQVLHDLIDQAVDALLLVADQCIGALGGPAAPITSGQRDDQVMMASWGSLITGVLSFFPVIGKPAGVVSLFAAADSMFVLPKQAVGPNPVGTSVGGHFTIEVIQSTSAAVDEVQTFYLNQDADFANALNNELSGKTLVTSTKLAIVPYSVQGNPNFGTLPRPVQPGVPIERTYVVVEVGQLYQAGKVHLAGAAAQYAQAASDQQGCTVYGSSTVLIPRSAGAFNDASGLLATGLRQTGEGLSTASEALMQIARDYQLTDEENAAMLRNVDGLQAPAAEQPRRIGGI
jgi:hypothetical protein